MLKEVVQNWNGDIEVDGQYMSVNDMLSRINSNTLDSIDSIVFHSAIANTFKSNSDVNNSIDSTVYRITVKQYMTEPSYDTFDFMEKFNNNIPMPLRTMVGTIEKETKGMYYMHLHGEARKTITCAVCGKDLTNPISRLYGIGPICLGKLGIVRDIEDASGIKEELEKIEWSGWVIKSAIIEKEVVDQ